MQLFLSVQRPVVQWGGSEPGDTSAPGPLLHHLMSSHIAQCNRRLRRDRGDTLAEGNLLLCNIMGVLNIAPRADGPPLVHHLIIKYVNIIFWQGVINKYYTVCVVIFVD